jgi:CheY-like chemotaxis protein
MRVLFIDDEKRRMAPVIEEFQSLHHTIQFQDTVDGALKLIRNSAEQFDVVVMDISMASGQEFLREETDGGARTGILLYEAIRQERPGQKIAVFTNVSDPRVADRFMSEDHRLCRFVRKPDVLPFQFVEEIEKFVASK